jgi:PAS domain S-box-containing protein
MSSEKEKKLGWFLDSIVENAPIMIFVKNGEDLKLELWNRRAEEYSGVKREDILGKTGFETFPADQMEEFNRRDREVLTGKKLSAAEEQLTGPSGEPRWLWTKKIPLLDEQGEPRYLLGISEDITEQRHTLDALQRAKEAAEGANRVKSEFFANVSHELRTPLTLIAGTVDSLLLGEAGDLPPAARERLQRLRRNAARLTSLVNDLLDFSTLEAGKAEARWQPVDACALVSDIVEEAQATAKSRGLALSLETAADVGHVPLDRRMFEKIVFNLLGNALKFTPAGGRVDMAVRLVGGELELTVKDTGVGIPAEKLPIIFERFQQVDSSASRKYEGSGIGLALAKELAQLMGGQISVESEIGKGSRFEVRIPCRPDHRALSQDGPQHERLASPLDHLVVPVATAPELTGKPRLILAEDNVDMRAYVTELLSSEYDIVAVDNGRAALAAARDYLPDVIVTDVMMPEMNGFELVTQLKQDPGLRQVPVLLLTARAGQEAIASGLQGGADDYLTKPFSPAELRARIAAARRLHKAYQDLALSMEELVTTRDQLVAAEKLSLAGRLARSVAEQLSGPLSLVQQRLAASSAGRSTPEVLAEARGAIDRVALLIAGLGRLAEPPSLMAPERVDVARFIESIVGELPQALSSRVSIREWAGQVGYTDIAPADLRVAVSNVLAFMCQSEQAPGEPIAVQVHKDRERPCVTISNATMRLSREEREHILDPRVEADDASGGGLRLDVGLAIASQILQRNGAQLHVRALAPDGIAFLMSFEDVL